MPTRGYRVPVPRRIAFINEKGGSAKTTLVANIASHLVLRRGRRVLAIDMDPQGQLGKVLGVDVRQTRRTAIDLVLDTLLGDPGLDRRAESSGDPTSSLPIVRTHLPSLDVIVANKSLALFPHWEGADAEDPSGFAGVSEGYLIHRIRVGKPVTPGLPVRLTISGKVAAGDVPLDEILISYIDAAQYSVDAAMYSLTLPQVADALIAVAAEARQPRR